GETAPTSPAGRGAQGRRGVPAGVAAVPRGEQTARVAVPPADEGLAESRRRRLAEEAAEHRRRANDDREGTLAARADAGDTIVPQAKGERHVEGGEDAGQKPRGGSCPPVGAHVAPVAHWRCP